MRLTQHTDYALRVLIYLGEHPDRRVTIKEVAEFFTIPRSHVMKIVSRLVQEGLLHGLRGRGGGIRLARETTTISVGDVVRRMERDFALVECFADRTRCALDSGCHLKVVLAGALDAFLAHLDQVTLAELVRPSHAPRIHVLKQWEAAD